MEATTTTSTVSPRQVILDLDSMDERRDDDEYFSHHSNDFLNAPPAMVDTSQSSAGSATSLQRRSTVNTETSILNITEETDDEESDTEEDDIFIMEDVVLETCQDSFHNTEFGPLPALCESSSREEESSDASLVDQVMDNLFDRMCFSSTTATPRSSSSNHCGAVETNQMIRMLGCIRPPDSKDEEVLHETQTLLSRMFCTRPSLAKSAPEDVTPHKLSSRHRRRRIRKLLRERGYACPKPLQPSSFRSVVSLRSRNFTVADNDDATTITSQQGYDSEPEDILRSKHQPLHHRAPSPRSVVATPDPSYTTTSEQNTTDYDLHAIVQGTLNHRGWDNLLWHDGDTPRAVRVWMERGTIVHNHHQRMIEPRLMWRVQPWDTPCSLPLLHICRIRPLQNASGLAQARTSLVLQEADDRQIVFQAPTSEIRDEIVWQWRVTVARFATLAVLEDANALLREFFTTTPTTPYKAVV